MNSLELKIEDIDQRISYPFKLDRIYSDKATQLQIFEEYEDLVNASLDGQNCTILALGQTGSEKSYSLEGVIDKHQHHGIILKSIFKIFSDIERLKEQGWKYDISVCFFEIINEELKDLFVFEEKLDRATLGIKNDDKAKRSWVTEATIMKI